MLMLPHEHMGEIFSFRLFHFYCFTCLANTSRCTYLFHTDTCIWKFLRINRIFFSNSHVLASRPAQSQGEQTMAQPTSPRAREEPTWMSACGLQNREGCELQGPRPRSSGVSALSSLRHPPSILRAETPCPSASSQCPGWGCPDRSPGPPWSLASLARPQAGAPAASLRPSLSPNSPSLASASPGCPRGPPPAASARTSPRQQLHPQPAFPCRILSPTTLIPEPHWSSWEASVTPSGAQDSGVLASCWAARPRPLSPGLWPEPHQLQPSLPPVTLPRALSDNL